MSEISPFAINLNNLETASETIDEQIQSENNIEEQKTEDFEEIKLDLPTNNTNNDLGFETVEVQKRPRITPEQQAEALVSNYLTVHPNLFLSGKQKRVLYREYLRKAKAGKFEKIFNSNI